MADLLATSVREHGDIKNTAMVEEKKSALRNATAAVKEVATEARDVQAQRNALIMQSSLILDPGDAGYLKKRYAVATSTVKFEEGVDPQEIVKAVETYTKKNTARFRELKARMSASRREGIEIKNVLVAMILDGRDGSADKVDDELRGKMGKFLKNLEVQDQPVAVTGSEKRDALFTIKPEDGKIAFDLLVVPDGDGVKLKSALPVSPDPAEGVHKAVTSAMRKSDAVMFEEWPASAQGQQKNGQQKSSPIDTKNLQSSATKLSDGALGDLQPGMPNLTTGPKGGGIPL